MDFNCLLHFSDKNIVSKFENDIKLPFQYKHKLLPENHQICKNRLINLKISSVKDKFWISKYNCNFLFQRTFLNDVLFLIHKGIINPFSNNVALLYPLKTSQNLRFSDVFRGYKSGTSAENGLKKFFWKK